MDTLTFVRRVLEIFGESDQHSDLFWRVTDGQIHLLAMCNDLFWWGTADCEEVTPENLPILEQALVDLQALDHLGRLAELFAARARKMRPQRPCYDKMSPEIAALFDACGPERNRADEG